MAGPSNKAGIRDQYGVGSVNCTGNVKSVSASGRTHSSSGEPQARRPEQDSSGAPQCAVNSTGKNLSQQDYPVKSEARHNPTKRSRHKGRLRYHDLPAYAALDLGTNNCRLLVAKPTRRGFKVIDAFSRIIRLGEGISRTGVLSEDAIKRTVAALRVCAEKMARRDVKRSRLIATEACRIARNGEEFVERVRYETGLRLEIVNRETEAKLAVLGCASLIDKDCDMALVFDIGGGSSELIWLDMSGRKNTSGQSLRDRVDVQNHIKCWTSLPVGVVTLSERYGGDEITPEIFEQMVTYVTSLLQVFEAENSIREKLKNGNAHLLGTSGTVTTLAGIHLDLPSYDRRRVDGCWMKIDEVRCVSESLAAMSYEQRVAQPCIGVERADLVLAGCAILEALMRLWPCDRLRVADRGLREGMLAKMMAEDGTQRSQRNMRHRGKRKRRNSGT